MGTTTSSSEEVVGILQLTALADVFLDFSEQLRSGRTGSNAIRKQDCLRTAGWVGRRWGRLCVGTAMGRLALECLPVRSIDAFCADHALEMLASQKVELQYVHYKNVYYTWSTFEQYMSLL